MIAEVGYRPGTAASQTIPFPTGGWNTRDPLDGMESYYAVEMRNIFPEERQGSVRPGAELFCTLADTPESLFEHVSESGSKTFLAVADSEIWNVTSGTGVSLASSLSTNKWQGFNFGGKLLLVSGGDQPQQWDGSSLSNATYTGIADDAVFVQGTAYRNRPYFVQANSQSFWYVVNASSITGAVAEFDCGPLLVRGGYLMFIATWTRKGGTALQEQLVAVSSEGETLIFAGANPAEDSFALVGHYFFSKPLGRRAYVSFGSDLWLYTQMGRVSLNDESSSDVVEADAIAPTFQDISETYASAQPYFWQPIFYPHGRAVLFNVPYDGISVADQFVMNAYTGAWCKFTGWQAACFVIYDDDLYFGAYDGKIYKAWVGADDAGASIDYLVRFSFNYLGDRERVKKASALRPLLVTDGDVQLGISVDVDFEERANAETVTITGSGGTPWGSDWGSPWSTGRRYIKDWRGVGAIGRCFSARFQGSISGVNFKMAAANLVYDVGSYI